MRRSIRDPHRAQPQSTVQFRKVRHFQDPVPWVMRSVLECRHALNHKTDCRRYRSEVTLDYYPPFKYTKSQMVAFRLGLGWHASAFYSYRAFLPMSELQSAVHV
ncbi:uncharacterized protein LOC112691355 [Sipha flava]|uniref:Uncharacterized protein LOC112691355 n=1 Tax=Sipha flava TaxID=143950 RepID=A0A8B8GEI7_9HEMI|nr:uncharacterized protein LOC112691355 [Sipha flava]